MPTCLKRVLEVAEVPSAPKKRRGKLRNCPPALEDKSEELDEHLFSLMSEPGNKGIVLAGNPGTGKTMLLDYVLQGYAHVLRVSATACGFKGMCRHFRRNPDVCILVIDQADMGIGTRRLFSEALSGTWWNNLTVIATTTVYSATVMHRLGVYGSERYTVNTFAYSVEDLDEILESQGYTGTTAKLIARKCVHLHKGDCRWALHQAQDHSRLPRLEVFLTPGARVVLACLLSVDKEEHQECELVRTVTTELHGRGFGDSILEDMRHHLDSLKSHGLIAPAGAHKVRIDCTKSRIRQYLLGVEGEPFLRSVVLNWN